MAVKGHPKFRGNEDDLREFLRLAESRIRNPERTPALQRWRDYKHRRLYEICVSRGDPLHKGWNMRALREHLIDLRGARLDGICTGYVDLRGVNLDGASMRGAWLKGAELECASLREVDFSPMGGEPRGLANAYGNGPTRLLDAQLAYADLTGANLSNADLSGANLVGANLTSANLSGSRIYGVSAWDVKLCDDKEKRRDLVITPNGAPDVRVDDLEVAQFVYLLLHGRKLRNVVNAITERGVLILGGFADSGLEQLRRLADAVRAAGYLPILFDFQRPEDRDYTETVQTLVGLSRFVIADLSGPSVAQELMATIPNFEIPFIPIMKMGMQPHSTFRDLARYPWVHPRVEYFTDIDDLAARLASAIIEPAETILRGKRQRLAGY